MTRLSISIRERAEEITRQEIERYADGINHRLAPLNSVGRILNRHKQDLERARKEGQPPPPTPLWMMNVQGYPR